MPVDSDHYVVGRGSPLVFRLARRAGDTNGPAGPGVYSQNNGGSASLVAAVWCGACATNVGGQVQGGAIAAIFDYLVASAGSVLMEQGAYTTTKALNVRYLRPTPLESCLMFEATRAVFGEDGTAEVDGTLSDGRSVVFATCTAQMVDKEKRRMWRQRAKL